MLTPREVAVELCIHLISLEILVIKRIPGGLFLLRTVQFYPRLPSSYLSLILMYQFTLPAIV